MLDLIFNLTSAKVTTIANVKKEGAHARTNQGNERKTEVFSGATGESSRCVTDNGKPMGKRKSKAECIGTASAF